MLSDVAIFERVARDLGPEVVLRPADPERDDGPLTSLPVRLVHRLQGFVIRSTSSPGSETDEDELRLATKALKQNTTVVNEPGSGVILVSYTATSPESARMIVEALTTAFIERHREQFSIESLLHESRDHLAAARQSRDDAAEAYVEQVIQSGIAGLETQVPRLETEISLLQSKLFEARVRREEIVQLKSSLSDRLQGIPAVILDRRPSVLIPNEEYETLLALKRLLLAQKQEMLIQERPSEEMRRREKEFDNQIAKLDQELKGTPKAVAQGAEMQENLGHSAMETRIVDLEVEDQGLAVRIGLLESKLDTEKSRMSVLQKQLLNATMTRTDLAAARDVEEGRHAHLLNRLSVLEALDKLDVNEEANLRVLQAPTLEREKVGPRRASLLLKGLLAGMLAAFAFAVLRQRFERRLRHPETCEHVRGVPVLGVVPPLSSLRRLEKLVRSARRRA
jgi:capsular polysaccharide biosynthesis protein